MRSAINKKEQTGAANSNAFFGKEQQSHFFAGGDTSFFNKGSNNKSSTNATATANGAPAVQKKDEGKEDKKDQLQRSPDPATTNTPVLQKKDDPGFKETVIKMKWTFDSTEFYHRIINTTRKTAPFKPIDQACFWQPFYGVAQQFQARHQQRHPLDLNEGTIVDVHVSGFYDEERTPCLNDVKIWHDEDVVKPAVIPTPKAPATPAPPPKPELYKKGMIGFDDKTPGRVYIKAKGINLKMLAAELYGDSNKFNHIYVYWDEKAKGAPLTGDSEMDVDSSVRIEFQLLTQDYKDLFNKSTTIIGRDIWGARAPITNDPKRSYEKYDKPLEDVYDTIVVHHSGNEGMRSMNEVQDHQMDEKEAADINYHYGISIGGYIYQGRPIEIKGAHVPNANTGKIGIVFLADLDEGTFDDDDELEPAMEASLLKMIHYLKAKYPGIKYLGGHQEVTPDRSCPGNLAMDKMSSWRNSTGLLPPVKTKP